MITSNKVMIRNGLPPPQVAPPPPNKGLRREERQQVRKRMGDWFRDTIHNKAALAETIGAQGGYLVPEELLLTVESMLLEKSLFGRLAWNLPMAAATLAVPTFNLTTAQAAGTSPLWGGMVLTSTKEGATLTESEPTFNQTTLTANVQGAIAFAPNQLVRDGGVVLAAYLERGFAELIAWTVDYLCFNANGAGKPLGVINADGTYVVTRDTTTTVTQTDLSNMVGHLVPACFSRAVWCFSVSAFAKVANLAAFIINNDGLLHLLGRPVYITEKLPAVGTKGDVLLFDPSMYALGTRWEEVVATTEEPIAFKTNSTAFRLIWRGDGCPLVKNTITLADGATVAGCAVALSTK